MKIVITARNFTNYDRAAIDSLRACGHEVVDLSGRNFTIATPESDMIEALSGAQAAICGLDPISQNVLAHCPNLQLVSRRSIGYDSIDLDACRAHGVAVTRLTGLVEGAVAEHVMAYILYFAKRIDLQNAAMQRGEWIRVMTPGAKGRTLGLVGFGGIGKEIAKRATAFGMRVVYTCRHPNPAWESEFGVTYRDMDGLLAESDYISLNVPLTDQTRGMFSAPQFERMKPTAVLINIARGGVVNVPALRKALDDGEIGGAAIDVYESEPCTDSPLVGCGKAVLTPHTAPFTSENFIAMNNRAAQNVLDFFAGALEDKYRLA